MNDLAKVLMAAGGALFLVGLLVWGSSHVPGLRGLDRLPGDLAWEQGGVRVYAPIATMLVLSAVLTLVLWLAQSFRR